MMFPFSSFFYGRESLYLFDHTVSTSSRFSQLPWITGRMNLLKSTLTVVEHCLFSKEWSSWVPRASRMVGFFQGSILFIYFFFYRGWAWDLRLFFFKTVFQRMQGFIVKEKIVLCFRISLISQVKILRV